MEDITVSLDKIFAYVIGANKKTDVAEEKNLIKLEK